ncbi:LOW QUALITY PROTEIN: uncharacterized protein CFAP97D2 [Cyanocitta cristata]
MHQAYLSILPCGNIFQLKWDKAKYEEHKERIQTAKPLVDTCAPRKYGHLHQNLGKLKSMIHHCCLLCLCKTRIISSSLLYTKLEEDQLSATERDNCLLLKKMSCIMRTKGQTDNKNDYKAKSLIEEKRKQELWKANQENCAILDRITKSQPQYQVQWHEDWQQAEKYMANIASYPRGQCKSQSRKDKNYSPGFPGPELKQEQ